MTDSAQFALYCLLLPAGSFLLLAGGAPRRGGPPLAPREPRGFPPPASLGVDPRRGGAAGDGGRARRCRLDHHARAGGAGLLPGPGVLARLSRARARPRAGPVLRPPVPL